MQPLEFGVATSAYQIEGAVDADGRGPSIWDTFTAQPDAVIDGSDGSVACRSYERFDDDVALLADLGVHVYRFSIAWPRIVPTGSGRVEPRGLDYYERIVDSLLRRGIRPLPTLYHWDLPQPLEDAGGWPARDTAERFAEYAAAVHDRFGDRVSQWATLNEPWCTAFLGYAAGAHAPGRREPDAAYRSMHHLLLAHALAAPLLGSDTGIVLNLAPIWPVSEEYATAARIIDAIRNRGWLDPLLDGRYPADLLDVAPVLTDPELVRDGDLAKIHGSAAWLGVNYYTPERIGAPADDPVGVGQDSSAYPYAPTHGFHPRPPHTAMGWEVEPAGLESLLVELADRAPHLPLAVTENGVAYDDHHVESDGTVDDGDRIAYFADHLAAVDRARAAGADVRTYIAWSLLDNFEWAEGYTKLFGLVAVDPATARRTPKRSFAWYAEHIRRAGERPDQVVPRSSP
jgi:beta-glucosidase